MRSIKFRMEGRGERFALIGFFACVIALSAYNSALRTDSHHWGLMLSQAIDLHEGRIPYEDFIILYGYFTTLVQSLWGSVFGFSFLSFGTLTAIVYSGLLSRVYLVIKHLSEPWVATLFLAVAFILHPFPVYPWADYYAGYFLSYAIFFLFTKDSGAPVRLIIAGLLLGLAVWSRYTYAIAVVPFLFAVLIATRYSLRLWMVLFLSFVTTNLLFLALFKFGYGINLLDALGIYKEVAESTSGVTGDWFTLHRIKHILSFSRAEDAFFIYLWFATFPLFLEAVKNRRLSKIELGTYITLSILGLVNLIHAMRIFEYFRMINSSVSLAIVSFWMIGNATRILIDQQNATDSRPMTFVWFFRKLPLLLFIPLLFLAFLSIRILWNFPLNTYITVQNSEFWAKARSARSVGERGKLTNEHNSEIWKNTRGFRELTYGKVGHVYFSNTNMLAFYRRLSLEICGRARIVNLTTDNIVGQICDHPRNVRMSVFNDYSLAALDRLEYQRIFIRGEFSDDDVLITQGNPYKGLLCLNRSELTMPDIEFIGSAGTKYYVLKNCIGRLKLGEVWAIDETSRLWTSSEHAEIHIMNIKHNTLPKLSLTLDTIVPRTVAIKLNNKILQSFDLKPGHPISFGPNEIELFPGNNLLSFDTGGSAERPGSGDPRRLAYNVHNFAIEGD